MSASPILTVAIPTFNRNAILFESLAPLLPQLEREAERVCLLIIDNASPAPVEETLAPLWQQFPHVSVRFVRNRYNVGANANILRCFELCDTPWVWTLGDDDDIRPEAIETILRSIETYPDAIYFNFLAGYGDLKKRDAPILTRGLEEFVDKVDQISNVLFISSGVYNAPRVNGNLNLGYAYIHTQPNFVPLLTSLGSEALCVLSDRQIVSHKSPADAEGQWSQMYYSLGIMALLELPLAPDLRRKLGLKILDSMPWHKMFTLQLMLLAQKDGDPRGALYLYDQLCYRLFYFDRSPKRRAQIRLYRAMLRAPRTAHTLLSLARRKKKSDYTFQNPLQRL